MKSTFQTTMAGVMAVLLVAGVAFASAAPLLESAIGEVLMQSGPGVPFVAVHAGDVLPKKGCVIRTGENGRALLRFSATDVVRVAASSELRVMCTAEQVNGRRVCCLALTSGSVRASLNRKVRSPRPDFAICSGSTVALAEGTDFEMQRPDAGSAATLVRVHEGSVQVSSAKSDGATDLLDSFNQNASDGHGGVLVAEGYQVEVTDDGSISPAVFAPQRTQAELAEDADRAAQAVRDNRHAGRSGADPRDTPPGQSFWSAPEPGHDRTNPSAFPPPPPDTVNEDVTVVSPSAP